MKNDIMVADIFIVTATVSKHHQRLDFRAFSASSIFQGVEERLFQCWSNPANLKLHSRSKFYDSHTFYKWLILEFREITISNPGEKCKICLGLGSPQVMLMAQAIFLGSDEELEVPRMSKWSMIWELLLLGLKSPFWWSIIQEDKYCAAMCCAF